MAAFDAGGITGFHLKDGGERIPMEYSSNHERCWCELSELTDAQLWEEADGLVEEYAKEAGRQLDAKLLVRLEGRLAPALASLEQESEECTEFRGTGEMGAERYERTKLLLEKAIAASTGSDADEIYELISAVILQRAIELGAPSAESMAAWHAASEKAAALVGGGNGSGAGDVNDYVGGTGDGGDGTGDGGGCPARPAECAIEGNEEALLEVKARVTMT